MLGRRFHLPRFIRWYCSSVVMLVVFLLFVSFTLIYWRWSCCLPCVSVGVLSFLVSIFYWGGSSPLVFRSCGPWWPLFLWIGGIVRAVIIVSIFSFGALSFERSRSYCSNIFTESEEQAPYPPTRGPLLPISRSPDVAALSHWYSFKETPGLEVLRLTRQCD